MMKRWNSRWLAYCRIEDTSAVAEKRRWPGGSNTGFTIWIHHMRQRFLEDHRAQLPFASTAACEQAFDSYLAGLPARPRSSAY